MAVGAFLPVLKVADDPRGLRPLEGMSDGTVILVAAAPGAVWAVLGRRTFQNLACIVGILIVGLTYVGAKGQAKELSSIVNIEVSPAIGLFMVVAGAICFGISGVKMRKPIKPPKR